MPVTAEDKKFLATFFEHDLTDEHMKILDERLIDPDFKKVYQDMLDQQYDKPTGKIISDYIPLIVMVSLVVIGIWLLLSR